MKTRVAIVVTEREKGTVRAPAPALGVGLALALAFAPLGAAERACAQSPAPHVEPQFPEGFLAVKWGMGIADVKKAIAGEDTARRARERFEETDKSQVLEVERFADCPTRKEKPCASLIVRPGGREHVYKEAEYFFNPFTGKLMRIVVKYRKDYAEIDERFTSMWGAPSTERTSKIEASSYLPEGKVLDKTWRRGRTEASLHYTIYPSHSNVGWVEYADIEEMKSFHFLEDQYEKMEREPREPGTLPGETPPDERLF